MNDNIHLKKYLTKENIHSGTPHKVLDKSKNFDCFIVIPCYNEYDYLFKTLDSINKQNPLLLEKTLVVIVINNSVKSNSNIKHNNEKTFDKLIGLNYSFEFVSIDCFSTETSFKDELAGVGLARKVGMDFSLKFIKDLNSIICSLDADTIIGENYLDSIYNNFKKNKINAAVVNFKHQNSSNSIIEEGIRKYELILKEIARNIEKTGSPYGYVSMGSTIVCNAKAYIAIGGMNTKKATEDFYFLQKFAKYKRVDKINEVLVYPSARASDRVFLGTGFRMSQFLLGKKIKDLFYPIKAFIILEDWLLIATSGFNKDIKDIMFQAQSISIDLYDFLKKENIENIWNKISENSTTENQFVSQFHRWFDAFKTYRFLNTYIS